MRRITILCCLICAFATGHAGLIIKTGLNFGAPKKSCKGLGICLVVMEESYTIPKKEVFFRVSNDRKNLEIQFPADLINTFPEQFRDGVFIQEETYELPEDLRAKLGINQPIRIPEGKYPLSEMDGMQGVLILIQ